MGNTSKPFRKALIVMPLTDSRSSGILQDNEEKMAEFAQLLTELFEDRVYGLLADIRLTHEYAGLTHFRDRILAPGMGNTLGRLCAKLVINKMIEDGKLEVVKRQESFSEYPISALIKAEKNVTNLSEMSEQ